MRPEARGKADIYLPDEKRISRIRARAQRRTLSAQWLCWYGALAQSRARISLLGEGIRCGNGNEYSGTTQPLAFVACSGQAWPHPLRNTNALLLGDGGDNRDHGVAKDAAGVEILLGEAAIADAVAGESLQMLKRGQNAFPTEPVKRPEQENIKFPLTGVTEQVKNPVCSALVRPVSLSSA